MIVKGLSDLDVFPTRIPAVVLNWNRKDETLACLQSLQEQRDVQVALIVVDNGPTDDSVCAVREQFPHATVIKTRANLVYADGNNIGITEHG